MHLLFIAPLLLPLLPLALSCSSQKPLAELREDYTGIVHTDLNNVKERIITLKGNTSCIEGTQGVQNCTQRNNMDFVSILHNLTCHMWNMKFNHTHRLVTSVLNSLECTCSLNLSEERQVRRRTAMSKNQKQQRKLDREAQKLCKVATILSSMTTCYEMLNSRLGNT